MIKEEILEAITDDKTMPFIQPEQLAGIVDFVIKNYKPSLPSNIDEAAKKWNEEHFRLEYYQTPKDAMSRSFKAGAEWMAGQGYTKEGIARPDDCEIWVNFTDTGIKDGDEVVVQIRKK